MPNDDTPAQTAVATRLAVVVVASAVAFIVFAVVTGESVDARSAAFPLTAWWVSPLGLYWVLCKTRVTAATVGGAFLVAEAGFLLAVYSDDSSTAAIGFVTIPFLLWIGTALAAGTARVITKRRRAESAS